MEIRTWKELLGAVREAARQTKRNAERQHGGYVKQREAMLLAVNSEGRVDDPLDYATPSRITIKMLRGAIHAMPRTATGLTIEGGVDWFEGFREYMSGHDYEPSVDVWEVEVPAHLIAEVRAEEEAAAGELPLDMAL